MERFYVRTLILFIVFQSFVIGNSWASDPLIHIKLTGVVYSDETYIRFKEGTTTGFDFDWDAYKIMSGGTTPSMYTIIGNVDYSINSIPAADSLSVVQLGIKILEESVYTMSFENSTGLHNYTLVDKKTNTQIAIDSSTVYSFIGSTTDATDRFELQWHDPSENNRQILTLGTKAQTKGKMNVTSCKGGIYVTLKDIQADTYKIEMIRIGGRVLQTITKEIQASTVYGEYIELSDFLVDGNYIARLTVNDTTESFHIVVLK